MLYSRSLLAIVIKVTSTPIPLLRELLHREPRWSAAQVISDSSWRLVLDFGNQPIDWLSITDCHKKIHWDNCISSWRFKEFARGSSAKPWEDGWWEGKGAETLRKSSNGGGLVLSHVWCCNTMDCSLPRSSGHGMSQARILQWVTISFSRVSSRPRDQT